MSGWDPANIWPFGKWVSILDVVQTTITNNFDEAANMNRERPAGQSATETGRQSQERTVREVWKRVRKLDYFRPGA